MSTRQRVILPQILINEGLADVAVLGLATSIAAEADVSLVHALARWRFVDADDLAAALAKATGMSLTSLSATASLPAIPALPKAVCSRLRVVPLVVREGTLVLAMSDPTDEPAVREVAKSTGLQVDRRLVHDDEVDAALRRLPRLDKTPLPSPLQVVHGEPSATGTLDEAFGELADNPSGVFTNNTIDIPMPRTNHANPRPPSPPSPPPSVPPPSVPPPSAPQQAVAAPWSPPPSPPPLPTAAGGPTQPMPVAPPAAVPSSALFSAEQTKEVDVRASFFAAGVVGDSDSAPPRPVSDDKTIPNDDVLFVMRVLVVADEPLQGRLVTAFGRRVKQVVGVDLMGAPHEIAARRYDQILVVEPANSVQGSQALALLAAKAKRGVVVVSDIPDIGRLPGVKATIARPRKDSDLIDVLLGVLTAAALG